MRTLLLVGLLAVVWTAVVAGFAVLLGFSDHPPARGLLRRSQSPNPPPRL
jgi:hypothetical protein